MKSDFETVYNRHKAGIYNFCCRMLNDVDEAKDVVQEIFLRFFESPVRFDGELPVKVWLFRSARNRCLNVIRDKGKFSNIGYGGDAIPVTEAADPDMRDASVVVESLLVRMSVDYREILILREWDEMSYEEIAQALDITVSAVKSKLFKARKQATAIYRKLYGDKKYEL